MLRNLNILNENGIIQISNGIKTVMNASGIFKFPVDDLDMDDCKFKPIKFFSYF